MAPSALVVRLRREEYTGANRCLPCTAVNLGLAAVVSGILWTLTTAVVGVATFAVACAVVYLRGYLVPGTPELTARYLPAWVLRLFGKEAVEATAVERDDDTATDAPLVDGGVLRPESAEPTPTPAFQSTWLDRTASVRGDGVDPAAVARAFGADDASRLGARAFVLDGNRSVRWVSEAALAADVAAAALLEERVSEWADFDHDRRRETLRGLRLSLDRCPNCGADLTLDTERVDPCCQKPHLVAELVCDTCHTAVGDAAVVDTDDVDSVPAALLE